MEALYRIRDIICSINDFEILFHEKYGISLNEAMLLCTISKLNGCTSGTIAEMLGLSSSNASKVILSVENKALITRMIGREDKRKMHFSLTPEGKTCIESIKCQSDDLMLAIENIKGI